MANNDHNFLSCFDRPIAFHRSFVNITGSITAALMLSQLVYWTLRTAEDEWIFKTREQWFDEIGLSRYEQETARKVLRKCGLIEEKLMKAPAKMHFRLKIQALKAGLLGGKTPTNIRKTTVETTYKTNTKTARARETKPPKPNGHGVLAHAAAIGNEFVQDFDFAPGQVSQAIIQTCENQLREGLSSEALAKELRLRWRRFKAIRHKWPQITPEMFFRKHFDDIAFLEDGATRKPEPGPVALASAKHTAPVKLAAKRGFSGQRQSLKPKPPPDIRVMPDEFTNPTARALAFRALKGDANFTSEEMAIWKREYDEIAEKKSAEYYAK